MHPRNIADKDTTSLVLSAMGASPRFRHLTACLSWLRPSEIALAGRVAHEWRAASTRTVQRPKRLDVPPKSLPKGVQVLAADVARSDTMLGSLAKSPSLILDHLNNYSHAFFKHPCMSRLRELTLTQALHLDAMPLLAYLQELHKLTLRMHRTSYSGRLGVTYYTRNRPEFWQAIQGLPLLHTVDALCLSAPSAHIPLPASLTHLRVRSIPKDGLPGLEPVLNQLKHLEFRGGPEDAPVDSSVFALVARAPNLQLFSCKAVRSELQPFREAMDSIMLQGTNRLALTRLMARGNLVEMELRPRLGGLSQVIEDNPTGKGSFSGRHFGHLTELTITASLSGSADLLDLMQRCGRRGATPLTCLSLCMLSRLTTPTTPATSSWFGWMRSEQKNGASEQRRQRG